MTLQKIKDAAAAYFSDNQVRTSLDLTVNGVDLFLVAVNQARRAALMSYDFEFTRVLAQVAVDGVSGGSLATATNYVTGESTTIGTVVDVGIFDATFNLVPVEWTTTGESLERQRRENRFGRELSTAEACLWTTEQHRLHGQRRVTFTGDWVFVWPKKADHVFTLGIECYTQQAEDWDAAALTTTPLPWTTVAQQYLLWSAIVQLNNLFKAFVNRQEGNLPPPTAMMQQGLEALVLWDSNRFEQSRRHGR